MIDGYFFTRDVDITSYSCLQRQEAASIFSFLTLGKG